MTICFLVIAFVVFCGVSISHLHRSETEILRLMRAYSVRKLPSGRDFGGNWWTGHELIQCSNGKLNRGTIYVALTRLEESGDIESKIHEETAKYGIAARRYKLK